MILSYTRQVADVYGYNKSVIHNVKIPIVSAATAFDDPESGIVYILIVNEGLYYGEKLDHSLINPNRVQQYGIPLWDNPFDEERGLKIEVNDELCTGLVIYGLWAQKFVWICI